MIGKLSFATIPQIAVMTLAWLAICLGIDYHFNPQLWAKNNEPPPTTVPSAFFTSSRHPLQRR